MSIHPYSDFVINIANSAASSGLLNDDMMAGHNGPYADRQTEVRNLSHWSIIMLAAFKITGDVMYKNQAITLLERILTFKGSFTYLHRQKEGKDVENGVIGTAWNIEAFMFGYIYTGNTTYLNEAIRLSNIFTFSKAFSLWERCSPNGENHGLDLTFNHQLWYAASVSMVWSVTKDVELKKQLDMFFNNISSIMGIHSSGLVKHPISTFWLENKIIACLKEFVNLCRKKVKKESLEYKEVGYHCFVVYAFAIIKSMGYCHSFFSSNILMQILDFTFSDVFLNLVKINNDEADVTRLPFHGIKIKGNRYAYAYNPVGYELPFINKVFELQNYDVCLSEFKYQNANWFNTLAKRACNSEDDFTLTARSYELARLFL